MILFPVRYSFDTFWKNYIFLDLFPVICHDMNRYVMVSCEYLIPCRVRSYNSFCKCCDMSWNRMISPDKTPDMFQVPVPSKAWKFESSSGQCANSLRCKELASSCLPDTGWHTTLNNLCLILVWYFFKTEGKELVCATRLPFSKLSPNQV